jgi:uncharacterized membrane protein YphA (DoxX/SURF4 family)
VLETAGSPWRRIQPELSFAVRLGLAAVALTAAIPKLADLRGSQQSVAAYQLFPAWLNRLIGTGLPIIELSLALLLVVGLLTRYAAIVFGLMLVVFIAGIVSAWVRGLDISCGCFSVGGALPPGQDAEYGKEILRDAGFLALAVFAAIWPRAATSLDAVLGLNGPAGGGDLVQWVSVDDGLLEDEERPSEDEGLDNDPRPTGRRHGASAIDLTGGLDDARLVDTEEQKD